MVAASVLAVLLPSCRKAAAPPPSLPPLVVVAQATARDVPLYIDEIGTCTAVESVAIRPQASGAITEIHFLDGAELRIGEPLFTIDPRPYQAALDQAKGTLAQATAARGLAKQLYEHAEALLPLDATSKEDYQTKQNSLETNLAQIQANRAAVESAEVNLGYCFIKSPIDGRASKRQVDIGNVVTAGGTTSLLSIQRMDPIYADFTITERDLPEVRARMVGNRLQAAVRTPGEDESAGRLGDLTFLDNAVQMSTGTVALRCTLANADRHFWPGQFVKVRLVLATLPRAVLVPARAVQISQSGTFVFVLKDDGTAELRPVRQGQRHGDEVAILQGVSAGETVITDGQLAVIPGQPVRIRPATTSQAASATAASAAASSRSTTTTSAPASGETR